MKRVIMYQDRQERTTYIGKAALRMSQGIESEKLYSSLRCMELKIKEYAKKNFCVSGIVFNTYADYYSFRILMQ